MDNIVSKCFHSLQTKLATIYEHREAINIAIIVFEDVFGISDAATSTQTLSAQEEEQIAQISKELLQHKPWQYVLGEADFYGLKFEVDASVLIPRIETEELVHHIINKDRGQAVHILDIGTGSGCIAVSLQYHLPQATVTGVDVSVDALELAQKNAQKNKTSTQFQQLDILDVKACKKMPKYHIIVSNPPYIQETEEHLMPKHVLDFEPHQALFVTNEDPLQFYKAIADFALQHLHSSAWLYFEINEHYGNEVLKLLEDKGFVECQLIQDFFGKNRIVLASL